MAGRLLFGSIALLVCAAPAGLAEEGLTNCAALFPDGLVANAPAMEAATAAGNIRICRRSGDVPFFALEYDPERFAATWVSYRIGDSFGEGGCASMTRRDMQCHFKAEDAHVCMEDDRGVSDPFHSDQVLAERDIPRLGVSAFSGTGHDRGHLAPNNSFSWHACGAYKTFTMANMAAQWASHNRKIWAQLETQVLFWGVRHGPVHVITGPIWGRFPADRFDAVARELVDVNDFAAPGELLAKLNRAALAQDIPVPTGFYKIVFRPGSGSEPNRAIGLLVPHTREEDLSYWYFVSTVILIEEASGLRFGFDDSAKGWPDLSYWRAESRKVPPGWSSPREGCAEKLPVAGWLGNRPISERVAVCRSSAPAG